MERRKFQTAASCLGPRKYLSPRPSTSPDKLSQSRASACSATAKPTEGRFDRTTSRAPNFSSARLTSHNRGMLRLGIVGPIHLSYGRAGPESNVSRQTTGIPDRGQVLQL